MDQEQEARAASQPKSRNGGIRAEDRARSFAPAAAAQDDAMGNSTTTNREIDATNLRVANLAEFPFYRARIAADGAPEAWTLADLEQFAADHPDDPFAGRVRAG